jgi:hypothetical protein
MKKKMRKFADGGFSAAQEEFLGGADRTDPYILARMRAAVPDEKIKESIVEETSADLDPYGAASKKPAAVEKTVVKTKVTPSSKVSTPKSESDDKKTSLPSKNNSLKELKDAISFGNIAKRLREKAGITSYNSGGKVKSASARADGCAIRGKTRA